MKKSIFRGLLVCFLALGIILPVSIPYGSGSDSSGAIIKVAEAKKKKKKKKISLKTHKKNVKYLLKMGIPKTFIFSGYSGRIGTKKKKEILARWQKYQQNQQNNSTSNQAEVPVAKSYNLYVVDYNINNYQSVFDANENATANLDIVNSGESIPSDIKVGFYMAQGTSLSDPNLGESTLLGEKVIPAAELEQGEPAYASLSFDMPSLPENYVTWVKVDSEGVLPETDEEDNVYELQLVVNPVTSKYNLHVSDYHYAFYNEDLIMLKATIVNEGEGIPTDMTVGFYISRGDTTENAVWFSSNIIDVEDLGSGVTVLSIGDYHFPKKPGVYTFSVKVDPEGNLSEWNEDDNSYSFTIVVD